MMVNENTRVCSLRFENGKKTGPFDWLPITLAEEEEEAHSSSMEPVTRSWTRNRAHWTNAWTITTCMMSLFS